MLQELTESVLLYRSSLYKLGLFSLVKWSLFFRSEVLIHVQQEEKKRQIKSLDILNNGVTLRSLFKEKLYSTYLYFIYKN